MSEMKAGRELDRRPCELLEESPKSLNDDCQEGPISPFGFWRWNSDQWRWCPIPISTNWAFLGKAELCEVELCQR